MGRIVPATALVAVLGVCLAGCGINFYKGSGITLPQASLPGCIQTDSGGARSTQVCTARPSPNPKGKVNCGGTYASTNLGLWGVDAMYTTPDGKHTTYWGTPIAVKKEKESR